MPALQGPVCPMPASLGQVFPALQGLTDPQESLQSRRANLVLCSQSGRAFCMCSAGTRKELRSSRSDTSQRSTHSGLKWLSWPKGTPPWDANDEVVRGFSYGAGHVSMGGCCASRCSPRLSRQMIALTVSLGSEDILVAKLSRFLCFSVRPAFPIYVACKVTGRCVIAAFTSVHRPGLELTLCRLCALP